MPGFDAGEERRLPYGVYKVPFFIKSAGGIISCCDVGMEISWLWRNMMWKKWKGEALSSFSLKN